MAAEPGPPSTPSEHAGGRPAADPQRPAAAPAERFGPVAVERHLKADGRALILYTRAGEEPA